MGLAPGRIGSLMPGRNAPSSRFNLRFGPAITPEQRVGYEELYPMFVAVRDLISGEAGVKETSLPKAKKGVPIGSFQGRHLDH